VVLHDITDRACLFIEFPAASHAKTFSHVNLYMRDIIPVPERLKKRVCEAEVEHVLDRFLSKVMVDAKDARLRKDGVQDPIQFLGRGEVTSKGLLDDHACIIGAS